MGGTPRAVTVVCRPLYGTLTAMHVVPELSPKDATGCTSVAFGLVHPANLCACSRVFRFGNRYLRLRVSATAVLGAVPRGGTCLQL